MDASEQGTIAQSGSTVHLAEVVDHTVGDFLGVDNLHVVADASTLRHLGVDVGLDELANALLEFLVGEVLHHEGGELTVEVGEEDDVSFAHLIEHAHQVPLAVGGSLGGLQGRDVGDIAIVTDGIVVDEIADVLDETVVTDGHVAKCGIVDA